MTSKPMLLPELIVLTVYRHHRVYIVRQTVGVRHIARSAVSLPHETPTYTDSNPGVPASGPGSAWGPSKAGPNLPGTLPGESGPPHVACCFLCLHMLQQDERICDCWSFFVVQN